MKAKDELSQATPRLALLIVDLAWKMLAEVQPIDMIATVRQVVGADIPVAGGYTLGQLAGEKTARILNQHFQVILLGD